VESWIVAMVDLTPEPGPLVVSKAPTPGISPQQVAQPYAEFANALDKSGEALGEVAKNAAEQAGYKAVTRDADGNIQIEKAPILGPASVAYSRAVKFAALAEGEAQLKQKDIALRTQYRDDPQGYLAAADAFKTDTVKKYTDAGGADLGITLGKGIDATTTQTYRGLLNESERLALQRADVSITAGIQSTKDDAFALARGGDTSSPAFMAAMDKINALTQERVNNPRLAYPAEAAQYDRDQFDGQLKGNAFLYSTDQVYKDKGVNDDGSAKGGAANALEYAKSILSDPSLKLTQEQRNAFYSKAVGEIHANEAIRRQDIGEARAAASSLAMQGAYGQQIAPEDVESVAQAFRAAGAPGEAAKIYATYARKPLNDDFGRQPIEVQTQQLNSLRQGGALATSPGEARLIQYESGGNTGLVNKLGYAGTYQFGAPLLKDIGVYTPGAGENTSDRNAPGQWSGQKWSGTFNVPGFPEVKTLKDFLANPAAQKAAFDVHSANMDSQISANGMDRFIGTNVGGVQITRDGLHAMIHLGGAAGTMQTLASGGAVNPHDANGTSLLDYARMGATAGAPNPASTMWLQANHATVLQKAARENWTSIVSDYDKTGQRPSDDTLNQVVNAARATNDHALLEGVGQFVDRMDTAQQQSQRPLAQQQYDITRLEAAGNTGQLSPGQSGVLKDLQRRYAAITKGLDENPISTTVTNFPDRFHTPAPITPEVVQNPEQLATILGQNAKIAQFAQQAWGGPSRSALDKADLAQVTAALDTPDPKVKGQIFAAITAALPQEVRDATLSKIGEKRPDFMVSAAAGGLMREAPDVAQSILRGQEALGVKEGNGTNARSAYAVQSAQDWNDQLKKDTVLPATAFSLQARSNPSGGYEVARDMIRARYADLSAQKGDTSGKIDADRVKQAADDVTGGILSHNGSPLVAPMRGMSQVNFDRTLQGMTDNDLAGVTTPDGKPVTANDVRDVATLESIGSGRYAVKLGSNTYAYRNADTEAPQKFVLDLRNRPMGQWAPSYSTMMTGAQL
jgi:hypothetical protein